MKALLSVYDKTGIEAFARGLADLGWELVSSGGTSAALTAAGIDHVEVADLTGAPEMLGGRVKTLHPVIHGGILADRSKPDHLDALEKLGIGLIDLVVCNLYPFTSDPSIELIDVGGPTMVRAAAKNHDHVAVVVDPADYDDILEELRAVGGDLPRDPPPARPAGLRPHRRLRRRHRGVARRAGAGALADGSDVGPTDLGTAPLLPESIHLTLERSASLRYGENPHQHGARYRVAGQESWWDDVVQYGGKELSYLNVFDADAAWRLVHELPVDRRRAGGGHHQARQPVRGGRRRRPGPRLRAGPGCDPQSAFGGIVAIGGPVTVAVAAAIAGAPGRRDHRPLLRRGGAGPALVQA